MPRNSGQDQENVDCDNSEASEADEYYYAIKKKLYYNSKNGYSRLLSSILQGIESTAIRNAIVNQVRILVRFHLSHLSLNQFFGF